MKVRLMGPRGSMYFTTELYELSPQYPPGKVKCCACPWWMDARCLPDTVWMDRAVRHECTKPWPGYASFTIRPRHQEGYRTA